MHHPKEAALQITKEIVVAKMSNSSLAPNNSTGQYVADFFETIYNKVAKLAVDISETE